MKALSLAAALAALSAALIATAADATILCKDDRRSNNYVCWDEATRYALHTPRMHKNGQPKTKDEVLEEGKTIVKRIMARTGRTDRVLLLDQNNRIVDEIPEWKLAFLRGE
ncbi:MAG: hypothetical protein IT563_12525 [Alphaproteobacteria bacterium]|nr:hypothetical protein [Alphaproteobacteria bacterium]